MTFRIMKIKSSKAITLVEALVTVLISSALIAGIYTIYIVGVRSWAHYSDHIGFKQQLRRALYAMINELREAREVFIVKDKGKVILNFFRPKVGMVSYSFDPTGDDARRIIREDSKQRRIIATNISSILFKNVTEDTVLIDIKAGEDEEFRLREKVTLRTKVGPFETKKR